MMPLATTSSVVPSYSMAMPTYAAPATTAYAAPATTATSSTRSSSSSADFGFFWARVVTLPDATTRNDCTTASNDPWLFQARMATKMNEKTAARSNSSETIATTIAASSTPASSAASRIICSSTQPQDSANSS